MENQHRKITGYRELDEHDITLINEIKAHERRGLDLVDEVRARLNYIDEVIASDDEAVLARERAEPYLWNRRGRRALQEASMFLVRAVAQPDPGE